MKLLSKWQLTIILFGLTPLSFFLSHNHSQWRLISNFISVIIMLSMGTLVALVCSGMIHVLRKYFKPQEQNGGKGTLYELGIIAVGMLLVFPCYLLSDEGRQFPILGIIIALAILICLLRVGSASVLNVLLLVSTVISLANLLRHEVYDYSMAKELKDDFVSSPVAMPHSFEFKHKPNIYFFFLESFHSREVIQEGYDFDAPEFFNKMEQANFIEYPQFYSNYEGTLESALAVFLMRHHYHLFSKDRLDFNRVGFDVLANNNVFTILKNNGYKINLFDWSTNYVFRKKSGKVDFESFTVEGEILTEIEEAFEYVNPYFTSLWSRLADVLREEHKYKKMTFDEVFKSVYPDILGIKDQPSFFYFHFGAMHILDGYEAFYPESKTTQWVKTYKQIYFQGIEMIEWYVDTIQSHDPEALIILVGDHGAWKYGREVELGNQEYWNGKRDINAMIRGHGLEPATVAAHMTKVFAAIRWPEGISPSKIRAGELSHVTLFPFVFSALGEKDYDAKAFERNISTNIVSMDDRHMLLVVDGKPLKDWKIVSLPKDITTLSKDMETNLSQ